MARPGEVVIKILGDTKGLGGALDKADGKLGKFAAGAGVAMAAVGAAAVAGAGFSIKAFADFDEKMTQSTAIMGDMTADTRKAMENTARAVAKTTKFSAAEAAESYFFLASAGMSAEQSMSALPQVAAFAQAGMFDMATATDLATDAQSALGLASDDAEQNLENLTRVTDVFVRANTLANTSVQQISEAMTNKAGAAMRSVGMEIESGAAVLAAFADQGVKGAEAGTQFAIVLRDLQTKALKNKDRFEELGIAVFDADGEFRNMGDIIGELEGSLDGMSDAQKKATLASLGFSDKSIGALQTLLGTSDAIREYEGELRNAAGFTEDVAGKQMETFNAKMGLLKDRLMDVAIGVGSVLVPMLLKLMDKAALLAPIFTEIMGAFRAFVEAFKAGNGDVTSSGLAGWFERLGNTVRAVFDGVTRVVEGFQAFWAGSSDDVGGKASEMRDTLADVWDQVKEIFASAAEAIGVIIETLVKVGTAIWEQFGKHIVRFIRETWNNVMQVLRGALNIIRGVLDVFIGIFTGDWSRFWGGIQGIVSGVWNMIQGIFRQALNIIRTVLGAGVAAIAAVWRTAWNGIKTFFSSTIGELLGNARAGFQSVKDAAVEKMRSLVDWVRGLPERIKGALGNLGRLLWNAGVDILKGLLDGLKHQWENVSGFVGGLGSKIKDLKGPIEKDRVLLTAEGGAIIEGLGEGMKAEWSMIQRLLKGFTGEIAGTTVPAPGVSRPGTSAIAGGGARAGSDDVLERLLRAIESRGGNSVTINAPRDADSKDLAERLAWTLATQR